MLIVGTQICHDVTDTGQAAWVRKLLLHRVVQRGRGAGEGLRLQAPLRCLQGAAVTFQIAHCTFYFSGGGRLVRPRQSYLRHHPVPDAGLRGPDLSVWPGPLPVRGHIRGPGRPLVLRLLPRGARDQPGGARPPRPGEAQSGQWDPDGGRGETRATGHGSERHAEVGDVYFLILSDGPMWS